LIDTSGSMLWDENYPGCNHSPLAPKLKEEIKNSIDDLFEDLEENQILKLCFYTFDEGIQSKKLFSIEKKGDKSYAKNHINSLKFEGGYTHICSSLEEVLKDYQATDHLVTIYLYTDGEENQEDPVTREVMYPNQDEIDPITGEVTNKFVDKIKSLREGGTWNNNEYLRIYTLGLVWVNEVDLNKIPNLAVNPKFLKYRISIEPTEKIDIGNLHDTGEGIVKLAFSIATDTGDEINWDEFIKKYSNLNISINPQEPFSGVENFIEDFSSIKLSSLTVGEYNLTFKIKKDEMIKNKKYGNFNCELAFSLKDEGAGKNEEVSFENNVKVSFSFIEPEKPEEYRISTSPTELDFGDLYDTAEGKATLAFTITTDSGLKVNWDKFLEKYPDLTVNITPKGFTSNIIDYIEKFTPIQLSSIKDGEYDLTFIVNKGRMRTDGKFGEFNGKLAFFINEQSISMAPILIHFKFYRPEVEVLPVSLNPGSLEGDITRTISFDYNEKALEDKSGFTVSIELSDDNPSLLSIGKNVLINNQTAKEVTISAPTSNIDFQISLAPNELDSGNYGGKLVFTSDELFIEGKNLILDLKNPERKYIPWTFTIPPLPVVTVNMLPIGEGKIPIDFGLIKEEKQYQQEIMLDFNQQAKGKELKVSLSISPDNPSELVIGKNLWINGQEKKSIDIISATKKIELVLEVTPSELKYGKYYGRINFTGDELKIKGANLEPDLTNTNQKYCEWTFKTPMPLWMKILIGAICLIVLSIIIYLIMTIIKGGSISLPSLKSSKAVIPDETYLYIRNYGTGKREQINISGKEEVVIGKDGQYLSDTEERIVLRAIKEDGKNLARLTVESGKVILVKAGSTKEEIVIEQNIYNRDIIKFGNYQIRVSGFYLEKDIN